MWVGIYAQYTRIGPQSFHVVGYIFTCIHTEFTKVYVYITCMHTQFPCGYVYICVYVHRV